MHARIPHGVHRFHGRQHGRVEFHDGCGMLGMGEDVNVEFSLSEAFRPKQDQRWHTIPHDIEELIQSFLGDEHGEWYNAVFAWDPDTLSIPLYGIVIPDQREQLFGIQGHWLTISCEGEASLNVANRAGLWARFMLPVAWCRAMGLQVDPALFELGALGALIARHSKLPVVDRPHKRKTMDVP
jgi:hypothetical protein